MAAKHFMVYYQHGAGTYVITSPRAWARENQNLFPSHDFASRTPTVNEIEKYLTETYGFKYLTKTSEVVLLQNSNPNFKFYKKD